MTTLTTLLLLILRFFPLAPWLVLGALAALALFGASSAATTLFLALLPLLAICVTLICVARSVGATRHRRSLPPMRGPPALWIVLSLVLLPQHSALLAQGLRETAAKLWRVNTTVAAAALNPVSLPHNPLQNLLAARGVQTTFAMAAVAQIPVPDYRKLLNLPVIDSRDPVYSGGVKADGVTDDRPALDAAYTAALNKPLGAIVQVPAGTLYFNSTWNPAVVPSTKSIWLRGSGGGVTKVKLNTAVAENSYAIHFAGTEGAPFHNVTVSDMSFEGTWNDGVARLNSGVCQAASSGSITLAATGSSPTNDFYNGQEIYITEDAGNPNAEGAVGTISDYDGATKIASVTWPSGSTPSAGAKYGILLDGAGLDQQIRGVVRLGYTWVKNGAIFNVGKYGGQGFIDLRASSDIRIYNVYAERVMENVVNCLGPTQGNSDINARITLVGFTFKDVGEGMDCAADYLTVSTGSITILAGSEDEGVDANQCHFSTFSDLTIIGGNNGIKVHGTVSANDGNVYAVTFTNIKCKDFKSGGVAVEMSTTDSTLQSAHHGKTRDLTFDSCTFESAKAGAAGMKLSWVGGSFPLFIDDVTVTSCRVNVPGEAVIATMNRHLTVRDSHFISTGKPAFYASSVSYSGEDIRVENCRLSGVASSPTSGGAIEMNGTIAPRLIDNVVTGAATGYGIRTINCRNPILRGNEVRSAGTYAIHVEWNSASYIDSDNDLKTFVERNRVLNYGTDNTNRYAISVSVNVNAASAYTGLFVRDNYATKTVGTSQNAYQIITHSSIVSLDLTFTGNYASSVYGAANKLNLTSKVTNSSNLSGNKLDSTWGAGIPVSVQGYFVNDVAASVSTAEMSYSPGAQSFGQTFAVSSGTAQGGATGSITLAAGASASNNFYLGWLVGTTGGTGSGQVRVVTSYDGTTKQANVSPNFNPAPDGTTTYFLYKPQVDAASTTTTTLAPTRWIATKPGAITRVWAKCSTAILTGTLTVTVYKGGSTTAFSTVLTAGETFDNAVQAAGLDTFVPGDEINIRYTTSADFTPVGSLDIRAGWEGEM